MDNGISVDKITGITAEKNRIAKIDTTATINLVTIAACVTSSAGKSISAIDSDKAFAVNIGSGICNKHVKGTNNHFNCLLWSKPYQ